MSSITGINSSAYDNPYSSAASRSKEAEEDEDTQAAATDETDGAAQTEEPALTEEQRKSLSDYKREFLQKVKALMLQPHLADVGLELNISDAGFEKMMNSSGYEKSVLDKLKESTTHSYSKLSGTVKLSANGESEPKAVMAESMSVSEILFSDSTSRSLLRTLNMDGMTAMAEGVIASLKGGGGKFDTAAQLGAAQMRSASSYLDSYLSSLGSVDKTG